MKRVTTCIGAICAAALLAAPTQADPVANARELTAAWKPIEVRAKGDSLVIVLPQRRITETIYLAVLTSGLCLGPLLNKPVQGISEVRILNEFAAQGYVYEKGLEDCGTFNSRPTNSEATKFDILAATHMY